MVMAKVMNSETDRLGSPSPSQPCRSQRVQNDTCYNCGKRGHWAYQCPLKTPPSPSPSLSSSSPIPLSDLPAISCPRCHATCPVRVSQSLKNPLKKYYSCPRSKVCLFFFFFLFLSLFCSCGFLLSLLFLSLFYHSLNNHGFSFDFYVFYFILLLLCVRMVNANSLHGSTM